MKATDCLSALLLAFLPGCAWMTAEVRSPGTAQHAAPQEESVWPPFEELAEMMLATLSEYEPPPGGEEVHLKWFSPRDDSWLGEAWYDGDSYTVSLNTVLKGLHPITGAHVLLHEWAHVLTMKAFPNRAHGPHWGVEFARLWETRMGQ